MRVTEKGQVTIPRNCATSWESELAVKVEFERDGQTLVLRKVEGARSRGRRLAERLRGGGDVPMTTDEIMDLTRGE